MRRLLTVRLLSLFAAAALLSVSWLSTAYDMRNFEKPNMPLYVGNHAPALTEHSGELRAVSYNIRYAENIETAIAELQTIEPLAGADILMLQEMDLAGTEQIARALEMNYVYAPASIHSHHERDFGNAILSRWPLKEAGKLILPHRHPLSQQMRLATRAIAEVGPLEVLVYSSHTETIFSTPGHRQDQFAVLVADIDPAMEFVLVGGDFNTVTAGSIGVLAGIMADAELTHQTAGNGPTLRRFGVSAQADHIFSRGFQAGDAGVVDGNASDHEPIWALLISTNLPPDA